MGVWDMTQDRQETAEWAVGNACEKCSIPFFWNVKEMWSQKTVGVRQVGWGTGKESVDIATRPSLSYEALLGLCWFRAKNSI